MLQFNNISDLKASLEKYRKADKVIGFVPTMGALHEGHLELVKMSKDTCDITVVSIFVNPTQFNNTSDLEKYPRNLEDDLSKLRVLDVEFVFHPSVEEVYPRGEEVRNDFDFGGLDEVMEGKFRPGHFAGVAQVVNRLLEIVEPDRLFMGQKDFQQVAIIRKLLDQTDHSTELVMCPTIRQIHGLAMSSRNVRLSLSTREKAACIFEGLAWIKNNILLKSIEELKQGFQERCSIPPFKVEYIDIVDGHRLQSLSNLSGQSYVVACAAVWAEDVRLIDNMILIES